MSFFFSFFSEDQQKLEFMGLNPLFFSRHLVIRGHRVYVHDDLTTPHGWLGESIDATLRETFAYRREGK